MKPEEASPNALALPVAERQREIVASLETARPSTGPDAARQHEALFDSWTQEPADNNDDTDLETLKAAFRANRIASGEIPL